MAVRLENHYLFMKSKQRCQEILNKKEISVGEIIDFLINLHFVLEIGLNGFFRQIILTQTQSTIDKIKIAENLDKINFIDKTILFFYLPHFDFKGDIQNVNKYHAAIGKLKEFSEIRNKLLHGHIDAIISYEDGSSTRSVTNQLTNNKNTMQKQIDAFKFIIEAISFYFDHFESAFSKTLKQELKNLYLNTDFLKTK